MMMTWALIALCMLGLGVCHHGNGRQHHHEEDFRQAMHHSRQDGRSNGGQVDESAIREYCQEMLRHHQIMQHIRNNPSEMEQYQEQIRQHHVAMQEFEPRMSHRRNGHHGRSRLRRHLNGGSHHGRFHNIMGDHVSSHHGRSRSRGFRGMRHHICDQYIDMQEFGQHRRGRTHMDRTRPALSNPDQDLAANL